MREASKAPITLPGSAQYDLVNPATHLKYRIQISWPLNWANTKEIRNDVPILYVLDGTALFLSASEVLWRRGTSSDSGTCGIIVAIGYQNVPTPTGSLFGSQRNFDLTLPHLGEPPDGLGGADSFLDFLAQRVKPLVRREFSRITFGNEAIFGHSFGGLCVLHALFTRDGMFDMYFAASPSIWWDETILKEEQQFKRHKKLNEDEKRCFLELSYGVLEQQPERLVGEPARDFEERKKRCTERAMGGNAVSMHKRLIESGQLQEVCLKAFEDEDHGTVVTCALLKAVTKVFGRPILS